MLGWWLLACGGAGDPTDGDPTGGDTATGAPIADLQAVASEVVPTTFQVSWSTPGPGRSFVEYGLEAPDEARTPESASATSHRVRVVGLKNNRVYRWRAVTILDDGTRLQSEVRELSTPPVPQTLPRPTRSVAEPDATVAAGFVVTTLIDPTGGFAVVLDGDGDVVWWYDTGHVGQPPLDLVGAAPPGWNGHTLPVTARIEPRTGDLLVQFYDGNQQDDIATLRRIPLDAMTIEDVITTRTMLGHHDFVFHPDLGQVSWLAYQVAEVDGARWASDVILSSAEGNRSLSGLTPIWSWLGDYPQPPVRFDPLQDQFAIASLGADHEWTHSNSLMFDEASGSYFVMSKFHDSLIRIDGRGGELMWTLGGPWSDFALPDGAPVWEGLDASRLWSHGHMSHLWYDAAAGTGGFVVFDNGYYYPARSGVGEGWSRLSEYVFDEEARTVEKVWEYLEPDGAFTALMGDVRRLSDDRLLAGWSSLGRIEELDRAGRVLWRVETPIGAITGRVSYTPVLHPEAM